MSIYHYYINHMPNYPHYSPREVWIGCAGKSKVKKTAAIPRTQANVDAVNQAPNVSQP